MADWMLIVYRDKLEELLAQAEIPKFCLPREQLEEQLAIVLAEQAARELDRTRRELAASLALARPDSPVCAPILLHMSAIDTELAERADNS